MGYPALEEPSRVLCGAARIGEAALVRPLPGPIALGDALVFSIACSVYKLCVVLRQERSWRAFSWLSAGRCKSARQAIPLRIEP